MIEVHSRQEGSYFFFLEIRDKLAGKMPLKTKLYHILTILENVYTKERKTKAQSTKFLVTPDKMVSL